MSPISDRFLLPESFKDASTVRSKQSRTRTTEMRMEEELGMLTDHGGRVSRMRRLDEFSEGGMGEKLETSHITPFFIVHRTGRCILQKVEPGAPGALGTFSHLIWDDGGGCHESLFGSAMRHGAQSW